MHPFCQDVASIGKADAVKELAAVGVLSYPNKETRTPFSH